MSRSTFKFLTRSGCHLCDEARPMVGLLVSRFGGVLDEVDIDANPGYRDIFDQRIPVILTPEDQVMAEGRIDKADLKRKLKRFSRGR